MGTVRSLEIAEDNIRWIEAHCRIPEGKFVGQRVQLRDWQQEIIRGLYGSPTRTGIVSYGRKNAKALALDTPILTVAGWSTVSSVKPGDFVFGSDGKPTKVLEVSPVFINKDCYRLTFSDGAQVVCSGDHLWTTRHRYRPWSKTIRRGSGNGGRPVVDTVTTEQIFASVHVRRHDGKKEHNHKLPVAPEIKTKAAGLPIDPYLFGYWLGDGTSASAAITTSEADLGHIVEYAQGHGDVIVHRYPNRAAKVAIRQGLQVALRQLGVLGNKHIPSVYFDAGTEQRWELLRGLMDSDGCVNRHAGKTTARCSFTNKSHDLAYGVWRLARSLGLKATIRSGEAKLNGLPCGEYWQCSFPASRETKVFRLERKQSLLPQSLGARSQTLTIVGCEKVDSVPTKCLMVGADDSLFLVGHGCVPTHNTTLAAMITLLHLCGPEAVRNSQLVSAAQSRDQAALLFNLMAKMIRMNPDMAEALTVRDTKKQVFFGELGTLYTAVSADVKTNFGASPIFIVHDELGQVVGPRSPLYEALETASGAHEAPMSLVISTQAPTDNDLLSILIDDAKTEADPKTKLFMWTAPEDLDPFAEDTIRQANPAFGDFLNAEETLHTAEKARRMPSREADYRNLILNQRVNRNNPFVSVGLWKENGADPRMEDFERGSVVIGLDLAERNDLTALILTAKGEDGNTSVLCRFYAPAEGVVERSQKDRVPYDLWAQQGFLTLTEGATVDYEYVARELAEISEQYSVASVKFDRWRMKYLRKELERLEVDLPLDDHGQGYASMGPALDAFEADLLNHRLRHGNNPILTWNAANATVIRDPAGNRKLDKSRSTGRIDGMVALAMTRDIYDDSPKVGDWLASL